MWRGVPKPFAPAAPAAGDSAVYISSQGERECVRAVTFTLTTDNTVANRRGRVRFLTGLGAVVAECASPFTLSASKSQIVSLYVGGTQFGANDAAVVGGPLYERWLDGLVTLEIGADAIAAGDTITDVQLDIVGYPVEWPDADGE